MADKIGFWSKTVRRVTHLETMDYLTQYVNVITDWPSGSPDMNPIENLGEH
jgi:hypothetical protein